MGTILIILAGMAGFTILCESINWLIHTKVFKYIATAVGVFLLLAFVVVTVVATFYPPKYRHAPAYGPHVQRPLSQGTYQDRKR